jgi:protein TonB
VRTAFRDVRRRNWPSLVQQRYAIAKAEFDRKNFTSALSGFAQVLDLLTDPDANAAANPHLADIRMLATEFSELSKARIPPPPPAPLPASASLAVSTLPAVSAPPPPSAAAPSAVSPSPSADARSLPTQSTAAKATLTPSTIFSAANPDVVAPVVIRQVLPPFPSQVGAAAPGVLEVVIDQTGSVESVTMRVSVNPYYDGKALDAARSWKFQPATRNGQPVKYRKIVQISVQR